MAALELPFSFGYGVKEFERHQLPDAIESAFTDGSLAITVVRNLVDIEAIHAKNPNLTPPGPENDNRLQPDVKHIYSAAGLGFTYISKKAITKALENTIPNFGEAQETVRELTARMFERPPTPIANLGIRELKHGVQASIDAHIDDVSTLVAASIELTHPASAPDGQPASMVEAIKARRPLPHRPFPKSEFFHAHWLQIPTIEFDGRFEESRRAQTPLFPGDAVIFPFGTVHKVEAQVPQRLSAVLSTPLFPITKALLKLSYLTRKQQHIDGYLN